MGATVEAPRTTRTASAPPVPLTLREAGLSPESVMALTVKTLYVQGARTGRQITASVRLPFEILDGILLDLQQRLLVEVMGVRGHGRGGYVFDLTSAGRDRAREAMQSSAYVGPAPVPLSHYAEWVERQSVKGVTIEPETIEAKLGHLVLPSELLFELGPAINSGRSMFLYGYAGNGKTEVAQSIAGMLEGKIYVPYAFEVEGRVIVVHDATHHLPTEEPDPDPDPEPGDGEWLRSPVEFDQRFVHVDRPVVFTGGELSLEQLDLRYDAHAKFYRAPLQVKANGGVLIIDDLGRQLVRPDELLNRWMVPLERRVDYLTLHTGHSFEVPFDCLLVFSTNLEPAELVDEAFLRRIHYKIHMSSPTREAYAEIFRRCCQGAGIGYDLSSVDRIYAEFYDGRQIAPRGCHPRDIVLHLRDLARYQRIEPELSEEMLGRACRSYFLDAE